MKTATTKPINADEALIEQFIRDSGVLLDIQMTTLKANLFQAAHSHGFEIVKFARRNGSILFTACVSDETSHRIGLRCDTTVRHLLRASGVEVSPAKLHVRHRRAVVRVVCTPDWD